MTPEQFAAAGEQGKRAADAAASLRDLPGFVGITLKDGKIVVEGSGPELQAKVAELNSLGPDEIVLVEPGKALPSLSSSGEAGGAATTPTPPASAAPPISAGGADPDGQALIAASTDQLFQAYVREVGVKGLQAVAFTDGHFVIRTGGSNSPESSPLVLVPPRESTSGETGSADAKMSPSEFVAKYANVKLEKGEPIAAEEDFFGGQGYYIDKATACSAGFSAFSPSGGPLVLTAGHCANDGAAQLAEVALPAGEPAGGSSVPPAVTGKLGTFGFSQFGGPNNSPITGDASNPNTIGNIGTDIAVIEAIRADLHILPEATTWGNLNTGGHAVEIVGATEPLLGQPVCKSGRTSGWTCGDVDEVGIYVAGGRNNVPYGADLRAFKGFSSASVKSAPGDSGGPWISGNFAVGTHTGAENAGSVQLRAIATTLNDAMTRLPGVQLAVFLNKPVLTSPVAGEQVAAGQAVTGRVDAAPATSIPANSKVRISVPCNDPIEVPIGTDGTWQFAAPAAVGKLTFTAETVNGFSRSGAASFEVNAGPGVLPAPQISNPAQGAVLTSVKHLEGTGTPGASVELSGGITGSATVSMDCRWTVPVNGDVAFGAVTVSATQKADGMQDSPSATRNFTLVPPAPTVTNVQDGQHFAWDAVPRELTGTGLDGALVTVNLDGVELDGAKAGESSVDAQDSTAAKESGPWSVPLPANLAAGAHTVTVTQSIDGVASAGSALTFIVDPKPTVTAVLPPDAPVGTPADPAGANNPASYRWLAATGAGGVWLFAAVGGIVLLLGSIVLVGVRRRPRR
jgi:hypothetical protein